MTPNPLPKCLRCGRDIPLNGRTVAAVAKLKYCGPECRDKADIETIRRDHP